MTINVERNFEEIVLELSGRLDSTTAPNLEKIIFELPRDTKSLILNFHELEYLSSAGLRVILKAEKEFGNDGAVKIVGATDMVREVFTMTGLSNLLAVTES